MAKIADAWEVLNLKIVSMAMIDEEEIFLFWTYTFIFPGDPQFVYRNGMDHCPHKSKCHESFYKTRAESDSK